jgi:two-component system OmpR family sensor kinase
MRSWPDRLRRSRVAEAIKTPGRPPSLFRQIAVRLTVLMALFALLDIAIVVPMYAFDQQALAEDFIEQQAHRVDRALGGSIPKSGMPASASALDNPIGVSSWNFAVVGEDLQPVMRGPAGPSAWRPEWPQASTLDWTRRNAGASGTLVSGARRFESKAGPYWILIDAKVSDSSAYWPVIGQELVEHVALPLIPLTLMLLVFSVQVVRRMLAPLEDAAREVDSLDPSRMEARLSAPQTSREVAILVNAVNRALDRLQHAMGLLKRFTADAAHELRTPLSVLRLRIDALPDSPGKSRLGEDVQAMTRLVNQMLDLAQADALRMDEAQEVEPHDLAAAVVSQIAPHAFSSGHDIELLDLGANPIFGHADALGRALRNLIENAIHHTKGGRPIEVIVGPGSRLSVRDHGGGIPEGEAGKIFDRFWRKSRSDDVGAGLGLGIVQSIVEAHGGKVTVQHPPGGGALFVCDFPNTSQVQRSPAFGRDTAAHSPPTESECP